MKDQDEERGERELSAARAREHQEKARRHAGWALGQLKKGVDQNDIFTALLNKPYWLKREEAGWVLAVALKWYWAQVSAEAERPAA